MLNGLTRLYSRLAFVPCPSQIHAVRFLSIPIVVSHPPPHCYELEQCLPHYPQAKVVDPA